MQSALTALTACVEVLERALEARRLIKEGKHVAALRVRFADMY